MRIVVGFDGSCPHDPAGVKEEGDARFRIFPSWRYTSGIDEEAVGRSTRLGFKVVNAGQSTESVDLLIDWQYHDAPPKDRPNFASVEHYMSYRDFVVVRWPKSEKWHTLMADVEDSVAHGTVSVAADETMGPGETALSLTLRRVPIGESFVVVKLCDSQSRALETQTLSLHRHPPAPGGVAEVKIDQEDRALLVNDELFFPIGI